MQEGLHQLRRNLRTTCYTGLQLGLYTHEQFCLVIRVYAAEFTHVKQRYMMLAALWTH